MPQCKNCGSWAINHHCHGRDGSDPDLCDVCYWRIRAEREETAETGMKTFVIHLREEHRLKLMCDYAYVRKYGNLAVVAPKVCLDVLREHEGLLAGHEVRWIEVPEM